VIQGGEEGKLAYEEQKRRRRLKEQLERKIQQTEDNCHRIESQLNTLVHTLSDPAFYQSVSQEEQQKTFKEKEKLESSLHKALAEWESLHEEHQKLG
jgi:citrate synthase